MSEYFDPFTQTLDENGSPISGATLLFSLAGTNIPKNSFADAEFTIPNTNPVISDGIGRFGPIFLDISTGLYDVVLSDSEGVVISSKSSVSGSSQSGNGLLSLAADDSPQLGADLDANRFSINESKASDIESALSTDIWDIDGNTVHVTGTATISDFGTPVDAGLWRKVIFDNVLTLQNSAKINLPGGANITTAPNDIAYVFADNATIALVRPYVRSTETAGGTGGGITATQLSEAVAAEAGLRTQSVTALAAQANTDRANAQTTHNQLQADIDSILVPDAPDGGITLAQLNARLAAVVENWAQVGVAFGVPKAKLSTILRSWVFSDVNEQIPEDRLTLAPKGATEVQAQDIAANSLKTGITQEQIQDIIDNALKRTYPEADQQKLANIAENATVGATVDQAEDIASNKSKLETIEEGAEVNAQADWDATNNTLDTFIQNKPTIPAAGATAQQATDITAAKTKLAGIDEGAQVNVAERTNDYINASLNGNVITLTRDNGQITILTIPTESGSTAPALTAEALVTLIDSLNATQVAAVKTDLGVPAAQSTDDIVNVSISGDVLTFTKRDGTTFDLTLPASNNGGGGGGGGNPNTATDVIDNLNSTSATAALSANQGRVIDTKFTLAGQNLVASVSDEVGAREAADTTLKSLVDVNTAKTGTTASERQRINDNTLARHSHANKTALDGIGVSSDGDLTINGNKVDTTIAQRDVYNGLDSTDTTISLAAAQAKVLNEKLIAGDAALGTRIGGKQGTLTAGSNITISGDTISSSGGTGSTYNLPDELDFLEANATLAGRSAFTDMSFATLAELSGNPIGFARQQNNLTEGNVEPDNEALIALYSTPTGASGANLRLEMEGVKLNTAKGLTLSNIGGGSPLSFGLVYLGEVASLVLPSRTVHAYRGATLNAFPRFVVGASKRVEIFKENGSALGWGTGANLALSNVSIDGYQTQMVSDLKLGALMSASEAGDATLLATINALPTTVVASPANGLTASVCYALDNTNNKLVAHSLVTGEIATGRNLPTADWKGMALWGNFLILLNNTLNQAFFINATTLENVPSKTIVLGTGTYQDIEVLNDILHVLVGGNRTIAYTLKATSPARSSAEDISISGFTPSISGGFTFMFVDSSVMHLVRATGSYVGFLAEGRRSSANDGQISRLSSDRFSAGFAANGLDYFLETGANKWQAHHSSNGVAAPTRDIALAASSYTGGCQGVLLAGESELANLLAVTPVDADKFPIRRTVAATTGSFNVTMGALATTSNAGYAVDASGTLNGSVIQIFNNAGTLSQLVPGLVALYLSTTHRITLVLSKDLVGAATGTIALGYGVINPTGPLDVFTTELFRNNPSGLTADFEVFTENAPSLVDDDARNAWGDGMLLQNVTAILSDGRSISPATPSEETTEAVLFAKLKELLQSEAAPQLTAAEILALLLPVDGPGSRLDADTLDGYQSSAYMRHVPTLLSGGINIGDDCNINVDYPVNTEGAPTTNKGKLICWDRSAGNSSSNEVKFAIDATGFYYQLTIGAFNTTAWVNLVGGASDTAAEILAKLVAIEDIDDDLVALISPNGKTAAELSAGKLGGHNAIDFFRFRRSLGDSLNIGTFNNYYRDYAENSINAPSAEKGKLFCWDRFDENALGLDFAVTETNFYFRTVTGPTSALVGSAWIGLVGGSGSAETAAQLLAKLLTIADFNTFTDALKQKLDAVTPYSLPEDLALIAADSLVERGQTTTAITFTNRNILGLVSETNPLFTRTIPGTTYRSGFVASGSITQNNNLLVAMYSAGGTASIEVTEPLATTGGITIAGTVYNLTRRFQAFSQFIASPWVTTYDIVGFSGGFTSGINYVVAMKKADGDVVHWGTFKRVIEGESIETRVVHTSLITTHENLVSEKTHAFAFKPGTVGAQTPESFGTGFVVRGEDGTGGGALVWDAHLNRAALRFSPTGALSSGLGAFDYLKSESQYFVSEERVLELFTAEQNEFHFLGLLPSNFFITLIPQIEMGDFAIGAEIKVNNDYRTGTEGISVWADNLRVHFNIGPSGYRLSDEVLLTQATRDNWRAQFHANT